MKYLITLVSLLLCSVFAAPTGFVYDNDDTASQIRLDLIKNESEIIRGNFYILTGLTGQIHAALLRDALRRGTKVKIIADWHGSKVDKALISHLIHEGAEFGVYHRFSIQSLSIKRLLRRMHDKLIIFGQDKMIVGDRNSGDHYFDLSESDKFISREFYLEDNLQTQKAIKYFDQLFTSNEVDQYQKILSKNHSKVKKISKTLDRVLDDLKNGRIGRRVNPALKFRNVRWNSNINWSSLTKPIDEVSFVHDPIGKKGEEPGTEKDIIELILSAKSSVILQNPYVVMTGTFINALREVINRGVQVSLITNSFAVNDVRMVAKAYEVDFPKLVKMGMRIYEYKGPSTLHIKNILVDGVAGYVGSYNLDPRSERLNMEVGIIYQSREIATAHSKQIRTDILNSNLVAREGESLVKKKKYWLFRNFILPILRNQL